MRRLLALALFWAFLLPATGFSQKDQDSKKPTSNGHAIIWRDPGDIKQKDLLRGTAGDDKPQLPVKFEEEDKAGHSPKFDVKDSAGTKWKVKMGDEAQSEPVASRLLWAVGYFANENFYLPELKVEGLPRLKR